MIANTMLGVLLFAYLFHNFSGWEYGQKVNLNLQ